VFQPPAAIVRVGHSTIILRVNALQGCTQDRGVARMWNTSIKIKNRYFVSTRILHILGELPFSQNQPLKYADDSYIRIFKNKRKTHDALDKIKKTNKIKQCYVTVIPAIILL
jgi:hypothetical protein